MPLIKAPEEVKNKVVSVSIPEPQLEEIDRYAAWVGADRGHIIRMAVKFVMERDKEWKAHNDPAANVEPIKIPA